MRGTLVVSNLNTTNGILIGAAGTLQLDVPTLELTGAGAVTLSANNALITAVTATDVLDNDGNQITGFGSITHLMLQNDGLIEAIGGTLILNTTNPIENGLDGTVGISGTLEASGTGTLEIHDNVNNEIHGQINTNGGTVDFKGAGTLVVSNLNTTNGILIGAAGTLQLDVPTLELTGAGAVTLSANNALITAVTATDVLDNDGNQITGFGSITHLMLQNDGLIEAIGGTLILNTTNPIENGLDGTVGISGTLEASGTGTLEIHDNVNNEIHGQINTNGGTVDFKGAGTLVVSNLNTTNGILIGAAGTLQLDVPTLELTGAGAVTLSANNALITAVTATDVLDNDGNQITGFGSITHLMLQNDGLIEAIGGTLILNTTNPIENGLDGTVGISGTLEASGTGTLEIHDNVNNEIHGQINTNGGTVDFKGAGTLVVSNLNTTNGILIGAAGTLQLDVPTLELTGAGAVTLTSGSKVIGSTIGDTLENVNNTISGAGTIGTGDGKLTLQNDVLGIIDATGGTLEINASVTGVGTLEVGSVSGDTLKLDSVSNAASLTFLGSAGTLELNTNGTLTLTNALVIGANTLKLDGGSSTLTDAAGITLAGGTISGLGALANNTNLTGWGTVSTPFKSADTVTASGGTLEFTNTVDSTTASTFHIANVANSVLKFDGAVGTNSVHPTIIFDGGDGGKGVLDLTSLSSLTNFHASVSGFDEGEGIKITGAVSASLNGTASTLTIYNSLIHSVATTLGTITLATSYAGDTFNVSGGIVTVDDLVATLSSTSVTQGTPVSVTVTDDGTLVTATTYKWQVSHNGGASWSDATGLGAATATYTPTEGDEGGTLQALVTYADAGNTGTENATSNTSNAVADSADLGATLSGLTSSNAVHGTAVSVSSVADGGTTVATGLSYQWQINNGSGFTNISGATSASYMPTTSNEGHALQVIVTYTDATGNESATVSAGTVQAASQEKNYVGGSGSHNWGTGIWGASGTPTSSDNVFIDASGTYSVLVEDNPDVALSLTVNAGGATVFASSNNDSSSGDTLTLGDSSGGGGNLTINAGTFIIGSGGTLKDIGNSAMITGAITNNGTIEAGRAGGTLEVASSSTITGTGIFQIDAGAKLQLDGPDTLNVVFAATTGTLILKDPTHFTAPFRKAVEAWSSGDVIDVAGFDASASISYNNGTHTVTITEAATCNRYPACRHEWRELAHYGARQQRYRHLDPRSARGFRHGHCRQRHDARYRNGEHCDRHLRQRQRHYRPARARRLPRNSPGRSSVLLGTGRLQTRIRSISRTSISRT